jgi:tetratricopeptide (TPR) repeat protein
LGAVRALVAESLAISRELESKIGIANSLNHLGFMTRDQGDYGAARALLEESLGISREVGNKEGIAWSLTGLGWSTHAQGDNGKARACFGQSLSIGREAWDKPRIARNMEGLAAVAVAQRHCERAARLFGAAEGLRAAIGAPLPPADRAEHDRSVAATRIALGKEAFAAAWAEGRAMSLAQACDYALQEQPDA